MVWCERFRVLGQHRERTVGRSVSKADVVQRRFFRPQSQKSSFAHRPSGCKGTQPGGVQFIASLEAHLVVQANPLPTTVVLLVVGDRA
jgi:hypothetical protein